MDFSILDTWYLLLYPHTFFLEKKGVGVYTHTFHCIVRYAEIPHVFFAIKGVGVYTDTYD
ncbi:hypothetical protein A2442_01680 [Candidatus Campbellbacteria bacterium RIFOXYC2_FULL_35_25]|uniref:Uncharacterized protein n=1 Tax=Candidatus Campbellbacteria bacterium RIFOXYC2_FULL_35_25 TaxID=1797582 RepID=A0A1F5EHF1_9BACT|nr:MAG: hypothetical protein A2442_01680 [Candidatus Campbellbacteria bacterium RIFOXYC2_FULL_35_25]